MFESIEPSPNSIDSWIITYTDESFDVLVADQTIDVIIKSFKARNLNIAVNLALLFQYDEKRWNVLISESIKESLPSNEYKKYHEDVIKYLLLI